MTRFEHENIVRLLGFCTGEEPFYVVMELMMHGDLKAYVLSHRHLINSGDPVSINQGIIPVVIGLYGAVSNVFNVSIIFKNQKD